MPRDSARPAPASDSSQDSHEATQGGHVPKKPSEAALEALDALSAELNLPLGQDRPAGQRPEDESGTEALDRNQGS